LPNLTECSKIREKINNLNSITLLAVGDISFGDFPFCVGYGVRSVMENQDNRFIFDKIKHIFEKANFVFGNLETTLSLHGLNKYSLESIEMRGDPKAVEYLKDCNFNVVNIANNHALQHGERAFYETVCLLKKNNIMPIGLTGRNGWHSKPFIMEANNIKIGFLGYAFESDKYFKYELKYAFGKPENIQEDIYKIKKDVDYIVISCHWGLEFMSRPSIATIRLARQIIDWGADVILGHHPHVLQGHERYKNGIIFYSLGNFVFDMLWDKKFKQSMIIKLFFDKSKSIHFEMVPIVINLSCQPEIADIKESLKLKELFKNLSDEIHKEITGDAEYNSYKYYTAYEILRKENRYRSYIYFFKNIYRSNLLIIYQILTRTILRRIKDYFS
jgi:poly-gamma-glutamate synthesis protein (capsule biosynthesis protein)